MYYAPILFYIIHDNVSLTQTFGCKIYQITQVFHYKIVSWKDTSTAKYRTPRPHIGLSESDSNMFANFVKGKSKSFENTLIYKAKHLCWQKLLKKILHIVEDVESSVQIDSLNT